MALRPAPKRKTVDYEQLDNLQKEIFGGVTETASTQPKEAPEPAVIVDSPAAETISAPTEAMRVDDQAIPATFTGMQDLADEIVRSKAGQGRATTRPFSLPRTMIIDTTRLKAKFRTIDEQFTQNVIIDFLLRYALTRVNPDNYRDLRTEAYEYIKRPEETSRRSLTVTEEVIYRMSELKAGINLETGRKYSNDEIFSTLLAYGVSTLYKTGVLE